MEQTTQTTNTIYRKKGIAAYQSIQAASMNKMEILLALLRGLLKNIAAAKDAYLAGNFETMYHEVERANRILIALQTHIDYKVGGEKAHALNQFYTGAYLRLNRAMGRKTVAEDFDYVHHHVLDIYTVWARLYAERPDLF